MVVCRLVASTVLAASLALATPGIAVAACQGVTQMDLNACAGDDLKASDTAMNLAYGRLMKRIGPRAQAALKDAQRAWLPYRDKTCLLESLPVEGGSAQPMVEAGCLAKVTDERTKVLNGYLDCEEGDMSCVGGLTE